MKTSTAIASMERGGVIFTDDLDNQDDIAILDGLVSSSELCKCVHGSFVWYFAWAEKPSESEADKAHQMAKAVRGSKQ